MKIEYRDYVIEQTAGDRFDLMVKTKRINKKTGEESEFLKDVAYSVRLETAVRLIVSEELNKREEIVSLKEFLIEYKREKEDLLKQFEV